MQLAKEVIVNEVQAMAKAGQAVGIILGTLILTARRASVGFSRASAQASRRASRRTARRVRHELAQHGLTPDQVQELVAMQARHARRALAHNADHTRQVLAGNVVKVRRELAARIDPAPRRRRRWPWLIVLVGAVGSATAYALSRRPQERPALVVDGDTPPRAIDPLTDTRNTNGTPSEGSRTAQSRAEDSGNGVMDTGPKPGSRSGRARQSAQRPTEEDSATG